MVVGLLLLRDLNNAAIKMKGIYTISITSSFAVPLRGESDPLRLQGVGSFRATVAASAGTKSNPRRGSICNYRKAYYLGLISWGTISPLT